MEVVQVKCPQKVNRFSCPDVGHKQSLHTHGDCLAASQDGQITHRLHHLHLQVSPLGTHLDCHIATNKNMCTVLVWLNYLVDFDMPINTKKNRIRFKNSISSFLPGAIAVTILCDLLSSDSSGIYFCRKCAVLVQSSVYVAFIILFSVGKIKSFTLTSDLGISKFQTFYNIKF